MSVREKAEFLFDEIGQIDDSLINSALSYKAPKKAKILQLSAIISAAACYVIVMALVLSRVLGGFETSKAQTLEETVKNTEIPGSYTALSISSELLFDGEAKIIWKFEDENEYYIKTVSERALLVDPGSEKSSYENENGFRMWFCPGDGTSSTPYLIKSNGNVGYGTLIEYSPEIEPDERCAKAIGSYLNR